jgi:hypothetical protein
VQIRTALQVGEAFRLVCYLSTCASCHSKKRIGKTDATFLSNITGYQESRSDLSHPGQTSEELEPTMST